MRPYLKDPNTNRQQLVDTGAVVSCWPRKDYPEAAIDTSILLEAVNKTRIATYGKVTRAVKIGRKTYNTEFILADIETPVLGWDFIVQHKISLIWSDCGTELSLVDRKAGISQRVWLEETSESILGLATLEVDEEGHVKDIHHKTFQQNTCQTPYVYITVQWI